MSSFAIFRALLVYLQGESHPLYIAERQLATPPSANALTRQFGIGCLFIALVIIFGLNFILQLLGVAPPAIGIVGLTPAALFIGWMISLGWTVPLAMYAGYAISRERAARTWDTLRLAPYTSDVILLSKAAASIRGVWGASLTIALTVTVLRMVIVSVLLVITASMAQLSPVVWIVFIPIALAVIVIEIVQEITLSVIVGMVVGMSNLSSRMTVFVGAVGGFMVRMTQLALIWWLLTHLASALSPYVAVSTTITGSTILLPAIPGIASLLVVILLAVGREGLMRLLLAWTLQRTHEG